MHSDLFGLIRTDNTPAWYISFTDEASRMKWVFYLKDKTTEALNIQIRQCVHIYKKMVYKLFISVPLILLQMELLSA